jgi:hypothetical protein
MAGPGGQRTEYPRYELRTALGAQWRWQPYVTMRVANRLGIHRRLSSLAQIAWVLHLLPRTLLHFSGTPQRWTTPFASPHANSRPSGLNVTA